MRKSNVLRGLTSVTAAVLAFAVVMTNTAMGYASMLNTSLGTATGKFVDKSGEEPPVYYASDYGDVNNLTQEDLEKLQADEEAFIEEEMEEGAVLLRNQENTLPLAEDERNITLFGYTSAHPLYKNSSGGGNNDPTRQVSLYDALKEKGFNINDTLYNAYLPEDPSFANVGSIGGPSVAEKPIDFYTDDLKSSFADYSDVAVVVLARYGGENTDVSTQDAEGISGLALHKNEADMLKMIKDSGQFDKIVLLLNSAYPIELNFLDEYGIDAVLWIGTPGLVGYRGVADLLTGAANPSGRLVDTFAANSLSAAATQNMGNYEYANQDEVKAGAVDSQISAGFPINYVGTYMVYQEGIYVGYKYYETRY